VRSAWPSRIARKLVKSRNARPPLAAISGSAARITAGVYSGVFGSGIFAGTYRSA
jgi:hypothetical protein